MSLKKIKTISIFGIFVLNFVSHFMYEIFPNFLFSIFFPVNESIFEHMKMISTSILLFSIIEHYLMKKNNLNIKNYIFNLWFCCIFNTIFFLILFLPIYNIIGENLIVTLIILFISIVVTQILSYKILTIKKDGCIIFSVCNV